MSNERLGLYDELREKAQQFERRDAERKRSLNMGIAYNGAYAQPTNPFDDGPKIPWRLKQAGFHRRHPDYGHRRREVAPQAKLGITIAQVVQATCLEASITHGELFSWHRERRLAYPRHACMYLIDLYCPEYSLHEIAYLFQRDHTSVVHGIKRTVERLKDKNFRVKLLVTNVHQRLAALAEGTS